jgi:hypothetical protein
MLEPPLWTQLSMRLFASLGYPASNKESFRDIGECMKGFVSAPVDEEEFSPSCEIASVLQNFVIVKRVLPQVFESGQRRYNCR